MLRHRHTESQCQQALVHWFAYAHRGLGVADARLLFAVPNGGMRSVVTAAILKREGVRPGVPDLFLAVSNRERGGRYHGLFIELKTLTGRIQDSQREMAALLRAEGYDVVFARGFVQAQRAIESYLRGGEAETGNN